MECCSCVAPKDFAFESEIMKNSDYLN